MGEQVMKEQKEAEEVVVVEQKDEEKVKSEPLPPPPPFVLHIDLHCVGCAKKIEKILTNMTGIEGVVIDMAHNQVTLKGLVEPQAICNRIMKKTKRMATVVSPLPPAAAGPDPQVVASQPTPPTTVNLDVNMHCEACAHQLKKKILKMKGVQKVETDLRSSKVTVTGTMDPLNLVDYVYQRTKKQAKIVPQPEPEPEPAPPEVNKESKDDQNNKPTEEKLDTQKSDQPDTEAGKAEDEKPEEMSQGAEHFQMMSLEEEHMKKMRYFYAPQLPPFYVVERLPPAPQMFSDENPNACSIC
uniref:HMA domain-containing protein n=1 Tax=Kalanchoe fedtschenkoi TaxID=63787 RepID=A0A7N0UCE7_KALFE